MIDLAYNPSLNVLCIRASGPQVASENEKLMAAVDELDRDGRTQKRPVAFILDLHPGAEPPDAHWRKRFAEQRKNMGAPRVFIAVVTTSRVLRGVMTAMNWISPDPPHVRSVNHATVEEAAAWVELVQGTPVAALRSLFGRVAPAPVAPAKAG
jgi:hypothetical protein